MNITLAGTIYDSNNNPVNAKYQVYYYSLNTGVSKWSNIRDTELNDYNINFLDPDLSSNDNTLGILNKGNEFALIAVWKDTPTRSETPEEFAYIVHELTGSEVIIQNIKLGIPSPIQCNFEVPSQITLSETIIATSSVTNESTYEAFSCIHYLYKKYRNEVVFPFLGSYLTEFDFGQGYSTSNIFTPESTGDVIVKSRVQDYFGNISECQKSTKVLLGIFQDFTFNSPIRLGDTLYVENTSGTPGSIYYMINGTRYDGENVQYIPLEYELISITQYLTYFDGYSYITSELTKTIQMENIPPEIDLEVSNSESVYTFKHNGTDVDGYIQKVKYEIYRNNPDISGADNYSLYYSTGELTDLSDFEFNFLNVTGELKVIVTVYDNLGASASSEYYIDQSCSPDTILCFENLDWTKKRVSLDFSTIIKKIDFSTNRVIVPFEVTKRVIPWTVNTIINDFSQRINKIDFKVKIKEVG